MSRDHHVVAAGLLAGLCLACVPQVSLVGKECNSEHLCGEGLVCCQGHCQTSCGPCPGAECNLGWAIDCAADRLCVDGCWQPCAECAQRCADPQYQRCRTQGVDESWFCLQSQVCLVRLAQGSRDALCYPLPPQCPTAVSATCDCLDNPLFSFYPPPCEPWESCQETVAGTVVCEMIEAVDAGMPHDATPPDASMIPDAGPSPADIGTSSDTSSYPDAGSIPDMAEASDASSPPDSNLPQDGASAGDAGPADASSSADSAQPMTDAGASDAATPCGPIPPDCFEPVGSGPLGDTCCAPFAVAASCVGAEWRCPTGRSFATRCNGYGDSCLQGEAPSCAPEDGCVWAWSGTGGTECAAFGPASPCVNDSWQCISGTEPRSRCGCFVPDCS